MSRGNREPGGKGGRDPVRGITTTAGLLLLAPVLSAPPAWAAGEAAVPLWTAFLPGWFLVLVLPGLAAFPLLFPALRSLSDGGWLPARTLGLLFSSWLAWLAASLEWAPFAPPLAWGSLCLTALISLPVLWARRREMAEFLRRRWPALLAGEAVFWSAVLLGLLLRLGHPDLWHPWFGGEKPMDLAYLNAVLTDGGFPPQDPWFAGEALNYYYFGFVLAAWPALASGAPGWLAYNLALISWMGLTAGAAFVCGWGLWRGTAPAGKASGAFSGRAAGVLAAVMALFMGNLHQPRLIWESLAGRWVGWRWYWEASRAIPAPQGEAPPITEFPFFTFLYGDLHAHLLAFPLALSVLGLALALVLSGRKRPGWIWCAWAALALGALWPANAWDVPGAWALLGLGLLAAAWDGRWRDRAAAALIWPGLALPAWLAFLPYHRHFRSAYLGAVAWTGSRSPWWSLLIVHGIFLFAWTWWLWRLAGEDGHARNRRAFGAVLSMAACAALMAFDLAGLGLWVLLAPAGLFLALNQRRTPGERLLLGLLVMGLSLIAGVEHLAVQGDVGRMNTVFKSYLMVWLIWSAAGGALGMGLLAGARNDWAGRAWAALWCLLLLAGLSYGPTATWARWQDRFPSRAGWTLDGRAFMETADHKEKETGFPLAPDLLAIRWLEKEVRERGGGRPVVAEAVLPAYHWGARFSAQTGLPTLLGWPGHQGQQRLAGPPGLVQAREILAKELYTTTSRERTEAIIRRFGIRYIVLGELERLQYPGPGLLKFEEWRGDPWEEVYRNPGTVIYRVPPLPAREEPSPARR